MKHIRGREVTQISIEDIEFDRTGAVDERYLQLIKQQYEGTLKIGLTRLRSGDVVPGFYIRENGRNIHISSNPPREVGIMQSHIKSGGRPSLEVYWNNFAPKGGGYVCPDAEWLEIYASLGIVKVPVRILRPKKLPGDEGSVWIEADGPCASLSQIVSPLSGDYAAYRDAISVDVDTAFCFLEQECIAAQNAVRDFHDGDTEVHYHQMVHAVLRRHGRALNSISLLIKEGRLEHASLVARSTYEAFLNYCLDWLSPEFFGPRMQFMGMIENNSELGGVDGNVLRNFKSFLSNTFEKARASSLGVNFYKGFYPTLSRVVHQSYLYVEREASDFNDTPDEAGSVTRLVLCMNVITFALVERVLDDVGAQT
ncbi:hypothetical protein [Sphingomonas sp. HMP6]|uniref:hypothetical protein n=1 Tax=Sphingomonas sp. HMP6 TaxID=1517551 RepID=UPI001596C13D|nr:hypothetical protein [Sphingomonas sp. HMP6]BCA57634.1 hypothetical protein HMP06_0403 [Sphingomonas sp. HMP6]